MDHTSFIPSPVEGHLGCFYFLTIVSDAIMTHCVILAPVFSEHSQTWLTAGVGAQHVEFTHTLFFP